MGTQGDTEVKLKLKMSLLTCHSVTGVAQEYT